MSTTAKKGSAVKAVGIIALTLAFVYVYPRLLIDNLGVSNPWTSYLYMYGFGGAFFGSGIVLILKSGSCQPGRGRDSKWLGFLIGGFIFFASLHAFWIYLAISVPFKGG